VIGSSESSELTGKIIGTLSGLMLWVIWGFLFFFIESISFRLNNQINLHYSLGTWIYLGPMPLFVGAGYLYFTRTYWSDLKLLQQAAALKGGVLGFFLWTAVIIIFPGIGEVSSIFPNLAGWLFMLVLILYFQRRVHAGDLPAE
jgi:hypothetical protein